MYGRANMVVMRGFRMDPSITKQKLKPGTIRRIASYARPYRVHLAVFLLATAVDAVITVVNPLLLREIIDHGILARNDRVVILIAVAVGAVAICDAFLGFVIRWFSARIGEGLIYDLRTQVFNHVQRQPIAFFTRAQTGSLVSRLDGDVVGAQQAITSTLSGVLSNLLSLVVILIALFYLSWQVSVIALVLIPLFILPARLVGRRMQRLTRESMQLNAEMGSTMTERFNVAGAMLVKLFGRPREESGAFASRAAKVRDIGVVTAMYGQVFFVALTLLASVVTAVVYGLGGTLVIHGTFQIGTLVALVLNEVSFSAPPGKLTALVGPSGAGKTTITALAARLYDPNEGAVRIGGYDVRDVTQESLHDVVGVVTQDAHLFHDTIRANLTYARPEATELELIQACEAAQIWDLISGMPDALDTVVGDRGYRLSGGEKQRVAVARLLLKAPSVVVLDEATAHLDSESEVAVQRALKTALAGRTSLVIAHRLSTIREADQILVVDAGRITQRGTHEELLTAGGLYADLYHTQFAGQAA